MGEPTTLYIYHFIYIISLLLSWSVSSILPSTTPAATLSRGRQWRRGCFVQSTRLGSMRFCQTLGIQSLARRGAEPPFSHIPPASHLDDCPLNLVLGVGLAVSY